MPDNAQYWIDKLGLIKHPEGGYYKEIYRSSEIISNQELSVKYDGLRNLASSIYFLLTSNDVSHFHRLRSDEIWYHHAGSALTIYMIAQDGKLTESKLGTNGTQGEIPQVIIPRGSIFGALVNQNNSFALIGCMVSPGFDFQDFELLSGAELRQKYPQHEKTIFMLT